MELAVALLYFSPSFFFFFPLISFDSLRKQTTIDQPLTA